MENFHGKQLFGISEWFEKKGIVWFIEILITIILT